MTPVADFEAAFAEYVGARYAIAHCNGTATLHTALAALDVRPGQYVAVPPLTMSSTALAVIHAGATPQWVDIDPDTWLMQQPAPGSIAVPVALYGLNPVLDWPGVTIVMDAAQTLMPHLPQYAFTSYSFQASKILSTGEGGMLVTNDEDLAARARSFASLGYPMAPDSPVIGKDALKSPYYNRHMRAGYNYRMAPAVADVGLKQLDRVQDLVMIRQMAANQYKDITAPWFRTQTVPDRWVHDYWTFPIACDRASRAFELADRVKDHGGEVPYAAWKLGYDETGLQYLPHDRCPVAEDLQPRLLQFQTNNIADAITNADALAAAIHDMT